MSSGGDGPGSKGDRGFILRLLGAAVVVLIASLALLDFLDSSSMGNCATRGFQRVTDTPSSD